MTVIDNQYQPRRGEVCQRDVPNQPLYAVECSVADSFDIGIFTTLAEAEQNFEQHLIALFECTFDIEETQATLKYCGYKVVRIRLVNSHTYHHWASPRRRLIPDANNLSYDEAKRLAFDILSGEWFGNWWQRFRYPRLARFINAYARKAKKASQRRDARRLRRSSR